MNPNKYLVLIFYIINTSLIAIVADANLANKETKQKHTRQLLFF